MRGAGKTVRALKYRPSSNVRAKRFWMERSHDPAASSNVQDKKSTGIDLQLRLLSRASDHVKAAGEIGPNSIDRLVPARVLRSPIAGVRDSIDLGGPQTCVRGGNAGLPPCQPRQAEGGADGIECLTTKAQRHPRLHDVELRERVGYGAGAQILDWDAAAHPARLNKDQHVGGIGLSTDQDAAPTGASDFGWLQERRPVP